jgi:hypothetical protein
MVAASAAALAACVTGERPTLESTDTSSRQSVLDSTITLRRTTTSTVVVAPGSTVGTDAPSGTRPHATGDPTPRPRTARRATATTVRPTTTTTRQTTTTAAREPGKVAGSYRPYAGGSAIRFTLDRVGPGGAVALDRTSIGRSPISFAFDNVPSGRYVLVITEVPADDDHDTVVNRTDELTISPGGEASLSCTWDDGCSVVT